MAYLFCLKKVTEYIVENLSQIKHTSVKCALLAQPPEAVKPRLEQVNLIVSSPRLDGVIAKLYHLSRSESIVLFREKKVFVNGRCMENNSGTCKEGDVISVRGFGRFVYNGSIHETKKGNLSISLARYV
jgi:RNA-binding protein YlmH